MASDGIAWCAHNADTLDLQFRGWLSKKFIHSNQTQMHSSEKGIRCFVWNFGRRFLKLNIPRLVHSKMGSTRVYIMTQTSLVISRV